MLLDLLLEIERIESPEQQEAFATGLYKTNKTFAGLTDLAYRRSKISRYANGEPFPEYKQDNVPYGYNFSQCEKIYNKLNIAGFTDYNSDRKLDDSIAAKKLVQVFESLSDIECQFIKYVLRKDIPWFSRESWKVAKHTE